MSSKVKVLATKLANSSSILRTHTVEGRGLTPGQVFLLPTHMCYDASIGMHTNVILKLKCILLEAPWIYRKC